MRACVLYACACVGVCVCVCVGGWVQCAASHKFAGTLCVSCGVRLHRAHCTYHGGVGTATMSYSIRVAAPQWQYAFSKRAHPARHLLRLDT
ncbi:hypothetical protein EON67_03580 [archaeon]|nr:MAG: hypothetical protein EON67_03580 [archaeon]